MMPYDEAVIFIVPIQTPLQTFLMRFSCPPTAGDPKMSAKTE